MSGMLIKKPGFSKKGGDNFGSDCIYNKDMSFLLYGKEIFKKEQD